FELDEQSEFGREKNLQRRIESERGFARVWRIVADEERLAVRRAAHVKLDARDAGLPDRPREGRERVLVSARAPAAVSKDFHAGCPRTPGPWPLVVVFAQAVGAGRNGCSVRVMTA